MKRRIIKIFALLMSISFIFSISMFVSAAKEETVEPRWANVSTVSCSIGADKVQTTVRGVPGVSKITLDIYVYVQSGSSWSYVTENHKTVNSMLLNDTFTFNMIAGGYYRADFTIVVTKNGVNETITQTKYYTN